MDYQTAVDTFFPATPTPAPSIVPVDAASPARRLRDALEPIATHAIWSRQTNERLAELGLDFLTGYVLGRMAPFDHAPTSLAVSTFGVFAPELVTGVYEQAREVADLDEVRRVREEATVASLRAILEDAEVEDLHIGYAAATLRRGLDAAEVVARPLFAALLAQPWPADPVGQLWRAAELYREHRGDSHLAVCVAAGLDPISMNVLTELYCGMPLGSYTASRGWQEAGIDRTIARLEADGLIRDDALTSEGWRLREELEQRTDAAQASILEVLGHEAHDLATMVGAWSDAIVEAGQFPGDPYKRAAG